MRNPLFLAFSTSTRCAWLSSSRTGPNSLCKKQSKLRQTKERKILPPPFLKVYGVCLTLSFPFLHFLCSRCARQSGCCLCTPLISNWTRITLPSLAASLCSSPQQPAARMLSRYWDTPGGVPFLSSSFSLLAFTSSASELLQLVLGGNGVSP